MQNMYSVFPELRTWVTVNDIGADFMPLKVVAYKSFLSTPMLYPLFVNLKFNHGISVTRWLDFLDIWPFATMKISPIISQICQNRSSILPNKK